ncbi:efflux transporter outer membrane subunit [Achromobacter aloeverae]|uniref:RND transporter n=1 Tax=Achromobacter aloeverae TaxID=1750518 RepID=A0A4Q1HF42_9BURK|nr:efflux transporter outer membrane subunit [Achromobacter aloeverae]RXN84469.1 RND transporter [Achromobacter aloeverae]
MLTYKSALSIMLASLLLAGCAVGPDYETPQTATSGHFKGQAAMQARQAPAGTDMRVWWEGFHDPVLAQLVGRALDQNLDIAQAVARVTRSHAALGQAEAALVPSAAVAGEAARGRQSLETPQGRLLNATPGYNRNGNYYELDLNAGWEIDLFGGLRREREAAIADYEAAQAAAAATRIAVAAQTADVYVAIRGLQARLAIARDQVRTRERLLSTVQLQFDKGLAAELQVRQSQGALAEVRATVPMLEDGLQAAVNALDILLAQPPGTSRDLLAVVAPIPEAPAIADTGTPADLLRRRPDLIVAERQLAASNARIGAAIAEYYPKVSLGALLGTATTASGHLFDNSANQTQGILGLRWRLFDFGRIEAEIADARGRNAEALAAYRLAVLRASKDVEDAFSTLVKREEQARYLDEGVAALARARVTSFTAYQSGVVSLIEVLDADSALLRTRDASVLARTEATRAAIASYRALGGGWDSPGAAKTLAAGW